MKTRSVTAVIDLKTGEEYPHCRLAYLTSLSGGTTTGIVTDLEGDDTRKAPLLVAKLRYNPSIGSVEVSEILGLYPPATRAALYREGSVDLHLDGGEKAQMSLIPVGIYGVEVPAV